jgi:hypothetical protein
MMVNQLRPIRYQLKKECVRLEDLEAVDGTTGHGYPNCAHVHLLREDRAAPLRRSAEPVRDDPGCDVRSMTRGRFHFGNS